jgi:chorismate mutase/prephenate dehydratase
MDKNNILKDARDKIDRLDKELAPLFIERMGVSAEIAELKRENNLSILDASREKIVIDNAVELAPPDYGAEMSLFMRTIISLSKSYQRKLLFTGENDQKAYLPEPAQRKTGGVKCVYQGLPGAWGEQAAFQMFPDGELIQTDYFEDVFTAVRDGKADYGVLPIENSQTGAIGENYDLIKKYNCFIVGKTVVEIRQCLLIREDAELSDVREIYSHPEGFKQCRSFLRGKQFDLIDCRNTAVAAKTVADSGDKRRAAIGSRRAAERFGLKVAAPDIMDSAGNTTSFIVIAAKPEYTAASDHVSVTFSVVHRSGALCEALMPFMTLGVNLRRIESRPGGKGSYRFFADLEGNIADENMRLALRQAEMATEYFEVTGCYSMEGEEA